MAGKGKFFSDFSENQRKSLKKLGLTVFFL